MQIYIGALATYSLLVSSSDNLSSSFLWDTKPLAHQTWVDKEALGM